MSTVHLCDGKDHALAEGDCSHVFAVVRVAMRGLVPAGAASRDLCRSCFRKFSDDHLKKNSFGAFEVSSLTPGGAE